MDAQDLLEVLEAADFKESASIALTRSREDYLLLNRQQLLEGKLSTGRDVAPTYFQDPFFKTPEAAQRYSDWKDKITPNSKRKKGVPNLFITGAFHNSLVMDVKGQDTLIEGLFEKSGAIVEKFGEDILGLTTDSADKLIEEKLQDEFCNDYRDKTGL